MGIGRAGKRTPHAPDQGGVRRDNRKKKLARYLVEFLPFETETETMVESVRVAMRPGLLPEDERKALWKKSARKYLSGGIYRRGSR